MTVRELIAALEALDPDLPVCTFEDCDWYVVDNVVVLNGSYYDLNDDMPCPAHNGKFAAL